MTLTPEEQAEALVLLDLAIAENERLRASVGRLAGALRSLGPKWRDDVYGHSRCENCGAKSDILNGTRHEARCPYSVLDDIDALRT